MDLEDLYGKVIPLQTDEAQMEVEVTTCEEPNTERRCVVPFPVNHLSKQH